MAKTKTPFLSMGSSGTVGGVLTSQKRGRDTILRETPVPTDPYSLNQAYQRWDYRDYAYLWTLLSDADKQIYRTKASKYHITGFSQWMRENLKDLTNLAGRWRLDEKSGAIAYDSSKQGHDGVIIGASPAAGVIDGSYYFDDVNDYVSIGAVLPATWTIEAFVKPTASTAQWLCGWTLPGYKPAIWLEAGTGRPIIYLNDTNFRYWDASAWNTLKDGLWHHVAFTLPGDAQTDIQNSQMLLDGELVSIFLTVATQPQFAKTAFAIGSDTGARTFHGHIDHFVIYDRILDSIEIKRHSLRRYPS